MEKENKKLRKEHEKAERARIIKLVDMAYKSDPRIREENKLVEAEKQQKKDDKRNWKIKQAQEREAIKKAYQDSLMAEENAKKKAREDELAAKKQKAMEYRKTVTELNKVLKETLPGTNFDRFWVESIER